jgi:hypothetical protein
VHSAWELVDDSLEVVIQPHNRMVAIAGTAAVSAAGTTLLLQPPAGAKKKVHV